MADETLLRALVDLRDKQIQKTRIQFNNRLAALERGADNGGDETQREVVERWHARFIELEKELDRDIARMVKPFPIYPHVVALKGVGPMFAAKLVAMIDIRRANTASALWRYCGMAVIDGQRERPVKGEKLHYNVRLKTACYLLGGSFLKSNSPYRAVYDSARAYYTLNRPDWTEGHRHQAAMRKMIKVFLTHLWERWRAIEGLPARPLYVHEYLGHTTRYEATDFGWPDASGVGG